MPADLSAEAFAKVEALAKAGIFGARVSWERGEVVPIPILPSVPILSVLVVGIKTVPILFQYPWITPPVADDHDLCCRMYLESKLAHILPVNCH